MNTVSTESQTQNIIWHYTTGEKLKMILRDRMVKTTDVYICPGEKPAAWFSTNQEWESMAAKSITDKHGYRTATKQEMIDRAQGLARIGIDRNTDGIMSWYRFKTTSGINRKIALALENVGYSVGSRPDCWFASYEPISSESWLSVQINFGQGWVDIPLAQYVTATETKEAA